MKDYFTEQYVPNCTSYKVLKHFEIDWDGGKSPSEAHESPGGNHHMNMVTISNAPLTKPSGECHCLGKVMLG